MSREELEKRILEARYNLVSSKDKETIDILEELAIKALEQERILDKIKAEIDRQRKWLLQAGYTAYNLDIAFNSIKSVIERSRNEQRRIKCR